MHFHKMAFRLVGDLGHLLEMLRICHYRVWHKNCCILKKTKLSLPLTNAVMLISRLLLQLQQFNGLEVQTYSMISIMEEKTLPLKLNVENLLLYQDHLTTYQPCNQKVSQIASL